jgi:hypothetical protein
MTILPNPHVSPLPGYASRPHAAHPVSLAESLRAIVAWCRSKRRPVPLKEQIKTARLVDEIATQIEQQDAEAEAKAKPRGKAKR